MTKDKKNQCSESCGKLKDLFFKPTKFLSSIEKEKSYQESLAFFVVISVIYFLLSAIVGLIFLDKNTTYLTYLKTSLLGFVGIVIYSAALPFLVAGLVQLGVLVFRGSEKYFVTFRVAAYSLVIGICYSALILAVSVVIRLFLPFDTSMLAGIEQVQDPQAMLNLYGQFFAQPGALLNVICSVIIMLISLIHQLVFLIKGISKFQKLTKIKAALSVILPFLLAFIIFILVVFVVTQLANI